MSGLTELSVSGVTTERSNGTRSRTDAEAASLSGLNVQQALTHRRRGGWFLEVCNVTCRSCQVSNSRSHGEAGTVKSGRQSRRTVSVLLN